MGEKEGITQREYLIALNLIPGVGKKTLHNFITRFNGKLSDAFRASEMELYNIPNLPGDVVKRIKKSEPIAEARAELARAENIGAKIVTIFDDDYPVNLKSIPVPPPVFYIQGNIERRDILAVAVVGTRAMTSYGKTMTERLVTALAERGITIVSGLAHGVDGLAHRIAIDTGSRTIAVLGNGLDHCYPPAHSALQKLIPSHGAVVTEFPMGRAPDKTTFPQRNHIISGFALGTLVIEAGEQSGALITARAALDQGRDVYAVPGRADMPKCKGTNNLIRQGAKIVETVQDIIDEFSPEARSLIEQPVATAENHGETAVTVRTMKLSKDEMTLYSLLENEELHIDSITLKSGLAPHKVSSLLSQLEIRGVIRQTAGKMFARL